MQINAKIYQDTLYIQIAGELDEHTANYAKMTIDNQLDEAECKQVVMDLSNLEFMDSTGIGVLMGRYKKMKQRGIPIFIANPSVQADKIFRMTALYEVMPKVKEGVR
ncbi:MAG: anti-sigma factor antagonist [Clostridia bacterium]|nr:anti-sigma factor antagonist [Clostridia bacterium]